MIEKQWTDKKGNIHYIVNGEEHVCDAKSVKTIEEIAEQYKDVLKRLAER